MQAITILENEYMVAWDRVSRADVLRAIKEYDRLGPERFFAEHGFAPATTYVLAWEISDLIPVPSRAGRQAP